MGKQKISQKFSRCQVVAVLLNLDSSSPNANTLSLFRDGVRMCEPQPLPEQLRGKVLYPTISYRNVTVQVNFGPSPLKPLPFKCHTIQEAASADCLVKNPCTPKDGKYEVIFP